MIAMKIALRVMIIVLKVGCTVYLIGKVAVSRLRQVRQTLERSFGMERREHTIMNGKQREEHGLSLSQNAGLTRMPPSMTATSLLSSGQKRDRLGDPGEKVHKGASRLYLAIVNRAILDALENGKDSAAAQRWLLSREFDKLDALFN